jgi:hypothetical protein
MMEQSSNEIKNLPEFLDVSKLDPSEVGVKCEHCGRMYRLCDLGNAELMATIGGRGCPSDDCPGREVAL